VSDGEAPVFPAEQGETLRRMEGASHYNRWLLTRAAPYLGARVLDVGAGIGTFTDLIADGRTVVALEPDPAFVPHLRRRFAQRDSVEVVAGHLDSLGRERFDSVVCFNVLEHIADDAGALRSIHDLLEPGGWLLALVPAHPAAFGSIDVALGHERRYTRRLLAGRLTEAGFRAKTLRHVNPLGIVGWFVASRIMREPQVPSTPLRLFDQLVPVLRELDRLRLPFGLSLWTVARRPG